MNDKIKVLQIAIGDGSFSGVTNFLCSYYSHFDRESVVFDFLYCRKSSLRLLQDKELLSQSEIYELHILKENSNIRDYFKLYNKLRQILKRRQYDIVHINTGNIYVQACCICASRDIKIRIAHSHSSQSYTHKNNGFKEMLKKILAFPSKIFIVTQASHLFACSYVAGNYLFGKFGTDLSKFLIIHNAIDTIRYRFDILRRKEVREKEKILPDTLVFGHVGRMVKVKNHEFLIEVFSEIHRLQPDSTLWIIGDGELKERIEEKISFLGLEQCVKLFGERNDVNDLMQAMDGFIFPSLFEGLSLVVMEAQNSGLPVYASDTISKEHKVTGLVDFLSLKSGKTYWAEYILEDILKNQRRDYSSVIAAAGYDLGKEAEKLENFYRNVVKDYEYT